MNKCKFCNKEISQKATFCSDKCRMAFKRSQPEQNKEIQPEQIQPEQVWTERGKCHSCGEEVSDLICICQECLKKGITHKGLGLDIKKCEG